MSDNHIVIIPAEPRYLPTDYQVAAVKEVLRQWMPEVEAIEDEISANVEFRDCGSNFEYVRCSECGKELTIAQWHVLMDQDYDLEHGFQLRCYPLPCCGEQASVNQLQYSFVQGFSRFTLTAVNPRIGQIDNEQVNTLRRLLGCSPIIIYRHI
ncbi:MAG: hypothetical protein M1154_11030 [Gammaproteobacteria bacterium]|nr:hypothetical protein [Gammaproteobacteria bacterium]